MSYVGLWDLRVQVDPNALENLIWSISVYIVVEDSPSEEFAACKCAFSHFFFLVIELFA
jgi:hypothetical protein